MRFSINDHVRVRLTDDGRFILKQKHEALYRKYGIKREWLGPIEDENGWSSWQLWTLMQDFGPHLTAGLEPPFEVEIEIPLPSEQT